MASSLLVHKRINTTLAKAKELRKYVEPLITKAKNDSTHTRRVVFSYLQDKESVSALFNEVVDRVADRPGGYTRIIKLGNRLGDNAEMAMIELVDFNDLLIREDESKKAKTRRSRRGSKSKKDQATAGAEDSALKEKPGDEVKAAAKVETVEEEVPEPAHEKIAEEDKHVEAEEIKAASGAKSEDKTEKKPDKADTQAAEVEAKKDVKQQASAEKKKEEKNTEEEAGEEEGEGKAEK